MTREKLLAQNDEMRWCRYGLRMKLNNLQSLIADVKYFTKNPLDLQKKYSDIADYVEKKLFIRYVVKPICEKDVFDFLYSEMKKTHVELKELKSKKKQVMDKLSKMPKDKIKAK